MKTSPLRLFSLRLVTVALTLAAMGCGSSAQLVRKDDRGGRVVLQGPFMPAMRDARTVMAARCQGRFDSVEQPGAVEFRCRRIGGVTTPIRQGSALSRK